MKPFMVGFASMSLLMLFAWFLIAGADRAKAETQQRIDLAVLKATNDLKAQHMKELEEYNKLMERMMKVIEGRR